ncbi:MAG: endonuclease/exonuclease/phosphatase family protein, partial [bacterium]
DYPHALAFAANTGEPSGLDLDRDGRTDGPGDAWGFGAFPGQYAFAILSRHPIDAAAIRSFRLLRWSAMPGARAPVDPESGAPWYAPEVWSALRLSSKNHVDVPISVAGKPLHLLVAHPTPPVFDGPEDRNGRRNADEIRLWADYLDPARAGWITDDAGRVGGLDPGASFVIAGDLNADPVDGDSADGAIAQLLDHPRIHREAARGALVPRSEGGKLAGRAPEHRGDPAHDTAGWGLRVDYVLPSADLQVIASGVFWPGPDDPAAALVDRQGERDPSSDHRLVWLDLRLP